MIQLFSIWYLTCRLFSGAQSSFSVTYMDSEVSLYSLPNFHFDTDLSDPIYNILILLDVVDVDLMSSRQTFTTISTELARPNLSVTILIQHITRPENIFNSLNLTWPNPTRKSWLLSPITRNRGNEVPSLITTQSSCRGTDLSVGIFIIVNQVRVPCLLQINWIWQRTSNKSLSLPYLHFDEFHDIRSPWYCFISCYSKLSIEIAVGAVVIPPSSTTERSTISPSYVVVRIKSCEHHASERVWRHFIGSIAFISTNCKSVVIRIWSDVKCPWQEI